MNVISTDKFIFLSIAISLHLKQKQSTNLKKNTKGMIIIDLQDNL